MGNQKNLRQKGIHKRQRSGNFSGEFWNFEREVKQIVKREATIACENGHQLIQRKFIFLSATPSHVANRVFQERLFNICKQ